MPETHRMTPDEIAALEQDAKAADAEGIYSKADVEFYHDARIGIPRLIAELRAVEAERDAAVRRAEALALVHIEARELVGEADATGVIPEANLNALRALIWRATVQGATR